MTVSLKVMRRNLQTESCITLFKMMAPSGFTKQQWDGVRTEPDNVRKGKWLVKQHLKVKCVIAGFSRQGNCLVLFTTKIFNSCCQTALSPKLRQLLAPG